MFCGIIPHNLRCKLILTLSNCEELDEDVANTCTHSGTETIPIATKKMTFTTLAT